MPSTAEDPRAAAERQHSDAVHRRQQARAAGDLPAWTQAVFDCAQALFALDQLPRAVRLYGEAIRLIEDSGQRRDLLPEALGMTGRTLQRLKRWDEVLAWYRRAAAAAAGQAQPAPQLRWALKEATTCLDMNLPEQGAALLEQVVASGRQLLDGGAPVAELLADALQRQAELDTTPREQADALFDEALQLLGTLPPGPAHFRAAVNRAGLCAGRGQHWLAQTCFEEALEVGRAVGIGPAERQQLIQQLAASLRARHEPVQAGDLLQSNLPGEHEARARHEFLRQAVDCYFAASAWAPMKQACLALREARRDMLPGWRYDAQMLLSVACRGLREYAESLAALEEGQLRAREWGDPDALAKVRGQTAIVLLDLGRHAESAAIGAALWEQGLRQPLTARTLVRALIGARELDRAEAVAQEFEGAGGEALTVAQLRAHLADAGRGDPAAAWRAVAAAAGAARSAQAEALTRLLQLAAPGSAQRFELARQRLRLIDLARASVSDIFSDASWRAAFEQADDFRGWLDEFVAEAGRGPHGAAAIYELERFRAQTLVNLLAERAALWSGGEPGRLWLKGQVSSQWQRSRYRYQALAARGAPWRERRALAAEVERLEVQALSAGGLIHFAPAEQGWRFPQDLHELLGDQPLAPGEVLLSAHPLPDRLALWLLDAAGATAHTELPGPGRDRALALCEALRAVGQGESVPDLAPLLAELDALWGAPVAAWLAGQGVRRAFLSAGTELAALPLDCCASLLAPAAPELVLLPSAAALGYARGVRRPLPERLFLVTQADRDAAATATMQRPRGRTLLLLDPTRELDFAPLETLVVACAHHGRQVDTLGGRRVDAAAVSGACGQAEVLHFAGHGDFDAASPYRSGLWLGPRSERGAIWTNADIFAGVQAPAGRLAVLSGCETGQTRPNFVSEEVSLPAAFIAAGYAAVVASRWAVDDLSATLLMGEFHRRWRAGGSSAAAALAASRRWLRELTRPQAQDLFGDLAAAVAVALPAQAARCRRLCAQARRLLAQGDELPFANPVYWAAFYASGDGAITAEGVDPRVPASGRPPRRGGTVRRRSK